MTKKTLAFTAVGWAGCTAAAFWAGMHWSRDAAGTDRGDARRLAIAQAAVAGAEERKAAGSNASDDASANQSGGPLSRIKAIADLTPEETTARMKDILAMDDPQEKMEAYLDFIKGLKGDTQLTAAMDALTENFNGRERGREFSMLMNRWAKESPEVALGWTQKFTDWRRDWGASMALSTWAQSDPDKALSWAQAHPPENKEEGNWNMVGVVAGLAKQNPQRAMEVAQLMDRSRARGDAMDRVLDSYFKQSGSDAARDAVMALPPGPYKDGIMGRLAGRLADKDPASAAQWAANLPEGEAKPRVVTEVIDEWAGRDPNEAGTWLNGLPKTAEMDEPRERFAWKVQEKDPEAAIAWANTITDEKRRNETAYRLAREWMNREPESVQQWLGTSSLPEDMKGRLMERLNRRRG